MALTTVPVSLSATALTLTTAAQPNITSVGTLTGLTVGGNIASTPNSGTLTIKAGRVDSTNNVRLEASGTTSTYLEYRGYLGHRWDIDTTEKMVLNGTGLGIQATPIAWYANQAVIQIGPQMTFHSETTSTTSQSAHMSLNAQLDTDASWEYILSSNKASNYYQFQGTHNWRVAPAGTAGNDITWTTAMSLDNDGDLTVAAGNVGIGGSPDSDSGLHLKGDGKRILVDSTDYNLVSLGRRGSSGASLDQGYLRLRSAGTNTVLIDTAGISYFNGGTLAVGTTSTVGSSAELFVVSGTGSAHSRFAGNSDSYSTVYIKNSSTTANTNQPFLTFQDTGGNRGNLGLRYSTAQLVIQGHGGVGIAAGSGGISNTPDLFVNTSGNVGIGTEYASSYYSKNLVVLTDGDGTGGLTLVSPATDDTAYICFADGVSGAARYAGYLGYSHNATENMFIGVGGSTQMTLRSDGKTAIGGNHNPSCALEVVASGEARIKARSTNNNWAGLDLESNSTQSNYIFFSDNSAERARIQVTDGNEMVFSNTASVTERMRLYSNGIFKITTPGNTADGTYYSTLTINNTGSSTYSRLRFDRSGSARWGIGLRPDDKFHIAKLFNTASDDTFVIDSSGNIGIGTGSPISLDGNAAPGLTIASNGPYILLKDANNANQVTYISNNTGVLQFGKVNDNGSTSKTEFMRISAGGKVGIGEGNPTAPLSVSANSTNTANHLLHVYRPDGLTHNGEPYSSILIQNQETSAGYQYEGVAIMASLQAHYRFQVGNTGSWGGSGAKRWQLRVGLGNAVDQMSIYSWTAGASNGGNEVVAWASNGTQTNHVVAGNYTFLAGSNHGQCGIGPLNTSYYHFIIQSGGPGTFYFGQPCQASGGFSTYSDERLKKEITPISDALTKVKKMNGVTFKWIDPENRGGADTGKQFGVTAQNMLEVDSELPTLNKEPLHNIKDDASEDDEYYTMDYSRITPFLIEAIKEQQVQIEALQAEVKALKGE